MVYQLEPASCKLTLICHVYESNARWGVRGAVWRTARFLITGTARHSDGKKSNAQAQSHRAEQRLQDPSAIKTCKLGDLLSRSEDC